ncbi:hypothetical protein AB0O22_17265 [Streptomyces sp. NPDC091204]|uniref:hypothetical protein n=1 Tax=Streptomyces sp. NPDC091204 TaxID=3155299 RepID=UPI0034398A52
MPTEMTSWTRQTPSRDFRDLYVGPQPDLILSLDIIPGRDGRDALRARMSGAATSGLYSAGYGPRLSVKPSTVRLKAAELCWLWDEVFVGFTPYDANDNLAGGRLEHPYADQIDLHGEPREEFLRILRELVLMGEQLLFHTLFGEEQDEVISFRDDLAKILAKEGLRIRFDSELFLPWPMMCLRPVDLPEVSQDEPEGLFERFLGYRHRIEQTGDAHPPTAAPTALTKPPVVSLNHDRTIDVTGQLTCKNMVASALKDGTVPCERARRHELLEALQDPRLDEHLMYFWCHGAFEPAGSEPPHLVIRLTDQMAIHAGNVHAWRTSIGKDTPFHPFVILNACHASASGGEADRAHLGGEFILSGARGVLGPQIGMPQKFAAEYALRFVRLYLDGDDTAGGIALTLARNFADELHNPLAIAYSLHYGMDTRLTRAPVTATGHEQEVVA